MQPNPQESSPNPEFHRVASNLYRRTSSGVYYALVKRGGKQFRKSLKTTDRELARRRLNDHREEVGSQVSHDAGKLTFQIAADRWQASERHALKESSALRRKHYLDAVAPFFEGLTLRDITRAHCERWLIERAVSIAPETFNHELGTMKAVFNYAQAQGLILRNPAQSIKRRRIVTAEKRIPSRERFEQLLATIRASDGRQGSQAAAKDGADFVELLAYSGMRLSEATALRWQDVAFDRRCLTVTGGERGTKNYQTRIVPMADALFGLLSRLHTERSPAPGDFVVRTGSAKKCLATACKKLGFPNYGHHTFRHFFITTCIENGVDVPTASKWAGHKDGGALAMRVYGHLRQEHSFAQIKRVDFAPSTQPRGQVTQAATATATSDPASGTATPSLTPTPA